MVLEGQFLERPALIDAGGVTLEGLYHRGDRSPALLLCPPLGGGGGMDAPPLAEMAWAAARAGHASLRFQHRGEGASGGRSDPEWALDDAEAARRHLAESAPAGRLAVAGLGSGCETALALAARRPEVARAVLVAPERLPAGAPRLAVLALLPEEGCRLSAEELRELLAPAGGLVEAIAGADPLFRKGLAVVGRRAVEWIERADR
jgi:pimeloyl-ACP methyl ester carboxylesterase